MDRRCAWVLCQGGYQFDQPVARNNEDTAKRHNEETQRSGLLARKKSEKQGQCLKGFILFVGDGPGGEGRDLPIVGILPTVDLQNLRSLYLVVLSMDRIYPFKIVICIGFEAASVNLYPPFLFKPLLSSELY